MERPVCVAVWALSLVALLPCAFASGYFELLDKFKIDYCKERVSIDNATGIVTAYIDEHCGTRWRSKERVLYGEFSVKMKLPPHDSMGLCVAFYLATYHQEPRTILHEIDVEFVNSGKYLGLQSNWWAQGVGDHEEMHDVPFDMSKDFHKYGVVWGRERLTWYVDDVPVRSLSSTHKDGFPHRPMYLTFSIWDATDWLGPMNWTYGKYEIQYKDFHYWGTEYHPAETYEQWVAPPDMAP